MVTDRLEAAMVPIGSFTFCLQILAMRCTRVDFGLNGFEMDRLKKGTDMEAAWKPLGAVSPRKLTNAHLQPYQLAQWLARFARGYLEPIPDDSHTSLQWRRDLHIMATGDASVGGRRLAIGLNPGNLTLVTLVDGVIAEEASMHGLNDNAAGDWVRGQLKDFDLEEKALDAPSPYEIPPSPYAGNTTYDASQDAAALAELGRYFDNAELLLRGVVDAHCAIKPGPSPVRLWPHHFDMATIITLEEGDFETARAVGVGLAVPDTQHKEFYFYNYPWPRDERGDLPKLASDSAYQYDGSVGAIQLMSKIVEAKDQEATARLFITETVNLFIGLLRKDMKR